MGKTGQPAWVKRIFKLLEQVKAKDPNFERFGAHSHQYKLSAPATEEAIQEFEEQQGIRYLEEYRGGWKLLMDGVETEKWIWGGALSLLYLLW